MTCCKNGTRRGPRGRVGWEDEAGCFLGTNLARILQFSWHSWLTLTKSCFSIVAVCWDGVRLCLLLWKQSGLLEVWGGSQYWVQQRLLRGSNPALWWRWPDHPLWQWVCLVPVTVEDTGTLGPGEQACPPLLSMYYFIHLVILVKHLLQARHWPDPAIQRWTRRLSPVLERKTFI